MSDDCRVPLRADDPADAELTAIYERVMAATGRVPNLYRALAQNPRLLEAWIDFGWPLRNDAVTDRGMRELVIMRTAQLNQADYEWRQHWPMATAAGVSEEQLRHLDDHPAGEGFDEAQQAALAMADELATTAGLTDAAFARLRGHFDDTQCMELVLTAAFYACVSRVINGLQIPLEASAANTPPVPPAPTDV